MDALSVQKKTSLSSWLIFFVLISAALNGVLYSQKAGVLAYTFANVALVIWAIYNVKDVRKKEISGELEKELALQRRNDSAILGALKENKKYFLSGLSVLILLNLLIISFPVYLGSMLMLLNFFALFAFVAWASYFAYKKNLAEMEKLAQALGWAFEKKGDISTLPSLFQIGRARKMLHVFSGTLADRPLRAFEFRYTVGSRRDSKQYFLGFFEITLSHSTLDLAVISRSAWIDEGFFRLAVSGEEKVTLEGNFSDFFDTWVSRGHQREARELLTPDVMAMMIDEKAGLGFLISGGRLYVNWQNQALRAGYFSLGAFRENLAKIERLLGKWLVPLEEIGEDMQVR